MIVSGAFPPQVDQLQQPPSMYADQLEPRSVHVHVSSQWSKLTTEEIRNHGNLVQGTAHAVRR